MKKIIIVFIMVLAAVNFAGARRGEKAGKITDGVFVDSEYSYSFEVPEAWDSSIKKKDSDVRVVLTKKEYDIPMHFQHVPTYTTIPKITVYADTTSLTVNQFVDSLLSDKFKSDQKSDILAEFKILFGDFSLKKRSAMIVGDINGYKISGQQKYTVRVESAGVGGDETSGAFGDYDVVTDFYGGSVFFAKENDTFVMMHFICEWRYFTVLDKEFDDIVKTFKFANSEG